jgi:hypothetical protein
MPEFGGQESRLQHRYLLTLGSGTHRHRAGKMISRLWVMVLALLILFPVPTFAQNPGAGPVYDVQCGCYADRANAARLVLRLKEHGLYWYSLRMDLCTRFIVDVNVDHQGNSAFVASYPEFADAFLVENFWDLPRPHPSEISPIPPEEQFTTIMAPYMQRQYQHGHYNPRGRPLADQQARMYTRLIYEATNYYGLDPFLLFAVGNFETYFRNIFGDLDRVQHERPDPAQGIFQILRSTARTIYQDMKKQKVPHTPERLPADLRAYPKAQIYFAAHYLHNLHLEYHGNRYMALLAYNGAYNPNYDYPHKVMGFYQRGLRYFMHSSQRQRQRGHVAARSVGPGRGYSLE